MTKFIQGRIKIKSYKHYERVIGVLDELGYVPMVSPDLDELMIRRRLMKGKCCWVYASAQGTWYTFGNIRPVQHSTKFTLRGFKARMEKIIKGCTCHPLAQVK